jgi:hypothetical protein
MREGLSPKIANLHSQTLQLMRYHIKTRYSNSATYNGHMQPDPFLGSGQGAGDSMAGWGFLSDALIRAYNKTAQSCPIKSPISPIAISEHIQAFVDDSHGLIIRSPNDARSVDDLIQHNMQQWEKLLHTIRGKLEISKCRFSKLEWTSNSQGISRSPIKKHSYNKKSCPHRDYNLSRRRHH